MYWETLIRKLCNVRRPVFAFFIYLGGGDLMGISSRQHSIKGEGGTTENWLSIKWQWEGNHKNIIKPVWGISGKFLPRHRDQNLPNSSPHSPQVVYNDRSLNWGYAFKTTASVNGLSCRTMDGWHVHPNFFFPFVSIPSSSGFVIEC